MEVSEEFPGCPTEASARHDNRQENGTTFTLLRSCYILSTALPGSKQPHVWAKSTDHCSYCIRAENKRARETSYLESVRLAGREEMGPTGLCGNSQWDGRALEAALVD